MSLVRDDASIDSITAQIEDSLKKIRISSELSANFDVIRKSINANNGNDEIDKRRAIEAVIASIRNTASEEFVDDLKKTISSQQKKNELRTFLFSRFLRSRTRLEKAIFKSNRDGNLNLAIGLGLAVASFVFLGYSIFAQVIQIDMIEYWYVHIAPKIVFSITVQVFAYFFLRLYKQSMDTIKQYHEELTLLELKYSAIVGSSIIEYGVTEKIISSSGGFFDFGDKNLNEANFIGPKEFSSNDQVIKLLSDIASMLKRNS